MILLSSCTIDWNDEKDKKIAELEKQVQDDTFKKKQECASYINRIEEENEKNQKLLSTNWDFYSSTLDEIFYSKKYSTCIAIGRLNWIMIGENWSDPIKESKRTLLNILSNELDSYDMLDNESMKVFAEAVSEFKSN